MNKINLLEVCKGANSIGISAHIRPDGDAIGSCLALYHYLRNMLPEVSVKVFLETPPACFAKMEGIGEIDSLFPEQEPFDVFFALDVAKEESRMGASYKYAETAKCVVNIDHHISNKSGSGDINFVLPEAAATCEVLFGLMEEEWMDAIEKSVPAKFLELNKTAFQLGRNA